MSTSEAIAVVRKLFEAVAHRDPAEVFGAYHPDIVISEAPSLPYGGEIADEKEQSGTLKGSAQPGIAISLRPFAILSLSS